jgi:pyruvate kinase
LRQRPEKTVAVMLDTKGPEIMTGEISGAKAYLKKDETIEITTNMEHSGDNIRFACDFEGLPDAVTQGQTILIDGRNVILEV